jgi:hypothetical protein
MQEARAALEQHEYQRAIDIATGVSTRIQETIAALDKSAAPAAARKRR